eukprot:scaffold184100_cov17-Cyclotella_meneghiniana.AAC.1
MISLHYQATANINEINGRRTSIFKHSSHAKPHLKRLTGRAAGAKANAAAGIRTNPVNLIVNV